VEAKAKMKTKLKADAKVTDNDLAPDNFLVEGGVKAKARVKTNAKLQVCWICWIC